MQNTLNGRGSTPSSTTQNKAHFLVRYEPTKEPHIEPLTVIGAYLFNSHSEELISIEDSEHKDWIAFVSQYVTIKDEEARQWTLAERCEFLNFLYGGASEGESLPDLLVPLVKPALAAVAD